MKKFLFLFLPIACCLLFTAAFSQTWYKLGTGVAYYGVNANCLKVINDELYVGGGFSTQGAGAKGNNIAKYNLTTEVWDSVGWGTNGTVNTIEEYNGEIYVGGWFSFAGWVPNTKGFAKWDGTQWLPAANSHNVGPVAIKHHNNLYIGGGGDKIGDVSSIPSPYHCCVFSYDGTSWGNMGGGIADSFGFPGVYAMAVYKNKLIVGGEFTHAGGKGGYNYIAGWDGTKWDSLGSGMDWVVGALTVDTVNDLLYAGGGFTKAGGKPTLYYAVWNGTAWQPIFAPSPNKPPASVFGNYAMKFWNGKLYAATETVLWSPYDTSLMYYDPPTNTWHQIYGPNARVMALEIYNGNLYAAGYFDKIDTTTVNCIACYGDSCPGTPIALTLPYGVNEVNKPAFKFKVFPNPAKKEIIVEMTPPPAPSPKGEGGYIVRVKNSIGQQIFSSSFTPTFQPSNLPLLRIDTSQFPKGLLLVEVCTPSLSGWDGVGLCHTEKVVIE